MRFLLVVVVLLLAACQDDSPNTKSINMYNGSGDMVGTATLTEQPDGVKIKLKLEGLTPGFHGIHVHEYPKCEGPDFKTAGNHLNPEGKEHGLMHPKGPHLGDLPNIEVESDGTVDAELMLQGATLHDGKKSILKEDGTSLIVDAGQDDGVSQPSGNSGERLICGEIRVDKKGSNTETPTDPTELNEKQKQE
ncbi:MULTISPECIES: superoxide dismutase family protein [unclassified Virgibacillus]|uniref:superoxide dismutase family protein n=1 Tax=unclassified Virgibacillus TaxID=2620237 RepID=UPI0024DE75E7|nr:superoxide dismutase family protein [Virgibacillus sp. LDC-1]